MSVTTFDFPAMWMGVNGEDHVTWSLRERAWMSCWRELCEAKDWTQFTLEILLLSKAMCFSLSWTATPSMKMNNIRRTTSSKSELVVLAQELSAK
jgi:hypothetical protein